MIKKLESSPDVQKRKAGKITAVYLDENDKPKTVAVNLNKSEYDKAIKAHERGCYVEIAGEISYGKKSSMTCTSFVVIEMVTTAIPLALDGGLRQLKVVVCVILTAWEHGNQKTDTNIYYSVILFLYVNTERSCLHQNIYRMI